MPTGAETLVPKLRRNMDAAGNDREKWDKLLTFFEQFPEEIKRAILERDYILAANLLSWNWIEGNDAANWDGKPSEWHPVGWRMDDRVHHFKSWYDTLQSNPLNMILAARKHTKTTFAITLMIWRSEFEPGHQSLYWANTEGQVEERMDEFEEMVEANPWLGNLTNDRGECRGALKRKSFENGSRILTTWVEGAFEGGHVDLMFGDDPMKEFKDISDEQIAQWYGRVIVPAINVDGLMAIVGTRKRPTDLYELLRTMHEGDDVPDGIPSYTLTEYPAIREAWESEYDRPGDLAPDACFTDVHAPDLAEWLNLDTESLSMLWPEARPPTWLMRNAGGQGKSNFLREMCMIFKQAEDAIVQRNWVTRTATKRDPPADLSTKWNPSDYPTPVTRGDFEEVVVGHDPAGAGRDRFAFVTVGTLTHDVNVLPGNYRQLLDEDEAGGKVQIRHILDVWQAQDVPPSRWRNKLTSLHDRYTPDSIAIESNLNATWTADDDEIPRRVRQTIDPIATTRRKHSWKDGVPSIGSDIEAGKYRFYNDADELITALTSVQMHDGELVGHTPDLVMALYMAHKQLTDGAGYIASSKRSLRHKDRETEEKERSKRRQLKGTPFEGVLDTNRRGF